MKIKSVLNNNRKALQRILDKQKLRTVLQRVCPASVGEKAPNLWEKEIFGVWKEGKISILAIPGTSITEQQMLFLQGWMGANRGKSHRASLLALYATSVGWEQAGGGGQMDNYGCCSLDSSREIPPGAQAHIPSDSRTCPAAFRLI